VVLFFDVLHEIETSGMTFKGKNALITGVGKGSIGVGSLGGRCPSSRHDDLDDDDHFMTL